MVSLEKILMIVIQTQQDVTSILCRSQHRIFAIVQPEKSLVYMASSQGRAVNTEKSDMAMAGKRCFCRKSHACTQVITLLQIDRQVILSRELPP